jgi:hypothetical protein
MILAAGRLTVANGQASNQAAAMKKELEPTAIRMQALTKAMVEFNKAEADDPPA